MYFITEGNTTNGIPEVALTDSLMGQIIISVNILVSNFWWISALGKKWKINLFLQGCTGKTIMLVLDGFCLSTEIILTQPGTEIVSVMVTKETSKCNHCIP